jgi:diguanylate cyclase (GGDEF)-like protein
MTLDVSRDADRPRTIHTDAVLVRNHLRSVATRLTSATHRLAPARLRQWGSAHARDWYISATPATPGGEVAPSARSAAWINGMIWLKLATAVLFCWLILANLDLVPAPAYTGDPTLNYWIAAAVTLGAFLIPVFVDHFYVRSWGDTQIDVNMIELSIIITVLLGLPQLAPLFAVAAVGVQSWRRRRHETTQGRYYVSMYNAGVFIMATIPVAFLPAYTPFWAMVAAVFAWATTWLAISALFQLLERPEGPSPIGSTLPIPVALVATLVIANQDPGIGLLFATVVAVLCGLALMVGLRMAQRADLMNRVLTYANQVTPNEMNGDGIFSDGEIVDQANVTALSHFKVDRSLIVLTDPANSEACPTIRFATMNVDGTTVAGAIPNPRQFLQKVRPISQPGLFACDGYTYWQVPLAAGPVTYGYLFLQVPTVLLDAMPACVSGTGASPNMTERKGLRGALKRIRGGLRQTSDRIKCSRVGQSLQGALSEWGSYKMGAHHFAEAVTSAVHYNRTAYHFHQMLMRDRLTGMYSRKWFDDNAERYLRAVPEGRVGAVVIGDVDNFKDINDLWGHAEGDQVLNTVARRLDEVVAAHGEGHVVRLGGDEFAIVTHVAADQARKHIALLCTQVDRAMSEPLGSDSAKGALSGASTLRTHVSLGVALSYDGWDMSNMMRRADAAMYEAKRTGKSGVESPSHWYLWSDVDHQPGGIAESNQLRTELKQPHAFDNLVLEYQPQVSLRTGRIEGVEALVRWNHPTLGWLTPNRFVPLVESLPSDVVERFTLAVLDRAIQDYLSLPYRSAELSLSVNLSRINLWSPGFARKVAQHCMRYNFPTRNLILEITESAEENPARRDTAVTEMKALVEIGVQLSLDDFGTGQANYRQTLTRGISEVKFDREMMQRPVNDSWDADPQRWESLLRHEITGLKEGGHMRIVAEGCDEEMMVWLRDNTDCDLVQSFSAHHPMRVGKLATLLRQQDAFADLDSSQPL